MLSFIDEITQTDMRSFFFALALTLPMAAFAQDFVAPHGPRQKISQQTEEPAVSIDGIVRQIFDVKKPWQLLNPAAPESYGTGEKNVSRDIKGGTPFQATTLTIAGIEW